MIEEYKSTYGIRIKPREMKDMMNNVDLVGLEILLQKKVADQKQVVAATIIQSRFRGFLWRRWFAKLKFVIVSAVL
jgi:hypothetical protein